MQLVEVPKPADFNRTPGGKKIVTSLSQCAPSNRTPDIFLRAAGHANTTNGLQNEGGGAAGRKITLCVYELLRPAPSFVREYRPDSDEQTERRTQSRPFIERRESQLAPDDARERSAKRTANAKPQLHATKPV